MAQLKPHRTWCTPSRLIFLWLSIAQAVLAEDVTITLMSTVFPVSTFFPSSTVRGTGPPAPSSVSATIARIITTSRTSSRPSQTITPTTLLSSIITSSPPTSTQPIVSSNAINHAAAPSPTSPTISNANNASATSTPAESSAAISNTGMYAGIAGVAGVVILVTFLTCCLCRRRKKQKKKSAQETNVANQVPPSEQAWDVVPDNQRDSLPVPMEIPAQSAYTPYVNQTYDGGRHPEMTFSNGYTMRDSVASSVPGMYDLPPHRRDDSREDARHLARSRLEGNEMSPYGQPAEGIHHFEDSNPPSTRYDSNITPRGRDLTRHPEQYGLGVSRESRGISVVSDTTDFSGLKSIYSDVSVSDYAESEVDPGSPSHFDDIPLNGSVVTPHRIQEPTPTPRTNVNVWPSDTSVMSV